MLSKPLGLWVRCVIKCRYFVLFASVAAAVWAGLYAFEHLKYKNKRLDLINPKSEWNQYWLDYISKFGSTDDVIIAVDGETPEKILDTVDAVSAELEKHSDMYYSIFSRVDDSAMVSKALHYASQDELQGLLMFLQSNSGVFSGHWESLSIDHLLGQSTQALLAPEGSIPEIVRTQSEETIDRLITSLEGVFGPEYRFVSPFPEVNITKHRSAVTTDPNGMRPNDGKNSASLFQGFPQQESQAILGTRPAPQPAAPNAFSAAASMTAVPVEAMVPVSSAPMGSAVPAVPATPVVSVAPTASKAPQGSLTAQAFPTNGGYTAYYPETYSSYAEIQALQQASENATAPANTVVPASATAGAPTASAAVAEVPTAGNQAVGAAMGTSVQPATHQVPVAAQAVGTPSDVYLTQPTAGVVSPQSQASITPRRLARPRTPRLPAAPEAMAASAAAHVGSNADVYSEAAAGSGSFPALAGMAQGTNSGRFLAESPENDENAELSLEASNQNVAAQSVEAASVDCADSQDSAQPAASQRSESLHYFWAVPNKTAVVMLKIKENGKAEFANGTKEVQTLRDILAKVGEEHPETKLSLTGLPIMEFDEMSSSQDTMNVATWLSILGVTLLYTFFFRGLRHPVMAVFALFIGLGWSMAFITFFIGHLNILSISFAVILVGLGIDFGIHFTSCYIEKRQQGTDTREALIRGAEQVGPGIVTGALTTAAAFFMAGLTEFTGVAELGQIAGGGILLCCMAAFTVLPIFIYTCDKRRAVEKLPKPANPEVLLAGFHTRRAFTLLLCFVLIGVCVYGMKGLYFDYNLLHLQPEGLESVELEKRLLEESKQSVWYALSMSKDREELLKRMESFNKLDSVERVEQILTLLPEEDAQRTGMIAQIHQILAQTPTVAGAAPVLSLQEMETCFTTITAYLKSKSQYSDYSERLAELRRNFHAMTSPVYFQRMQAYQKCLGEDMLAKLQSLQKVSSPEAPTLADLPQALVDRFMAPDGTFLLKVYGKGDLWDMDSLRHFVKEVRTVDPHATGNPLQTYECSLQMKACYEEAAWYALAVVLVLLYLDLRSVRYTLFAVSPVLFGMVCTFGIMGFFGIPLNSANMIVLPLILGIGIDDGVHIVHDFRLQHSSGAYRLTPSVSMSVILTSLTTIMGFGTLMIAQHRGLQSLGMVLSLGVGCCGLTSLLLLPALLSTFCRTAKETKSADKRQAKSGSASETAAQTETEHPNVRSVRAQSTDASTGGTPKLQINRYTSTSTGEIQQSTVRAA